MRDRALDPRERQRRAHINKTHSRLRLVGQSKPGQYEAETGGHPGVRAELRPSLARRRPTIQTAKIG
jgi:hypothetical protein